MKLRDHLRHHGTRNAATNADIHRAARQPQPLLDIFLRHPQLFKDQAGMLEKLSPQSVNTTPWLRRINSLAPSTSSSS